MPYAAQLEIARLEDEHAVLIERANAFTEANKREYALEIARRAKDAARKIASKTSTCAAPSARAVPREHCSSLSCARFRREYVRRDVPVVITGLRDVLTEDGADGERCAWLTRRAGNKKVAVTRDHGHRNSTASCASTDVVDLREYFDEVTKDASPGSYLYDVSVPLKLPTLTESIFLPKYFAHDYVQRTMRLTAFSRSWPSLFVAAKDTRSTLHVDQWQGHFFMAMIRGTKRWTVFHRDATPFLRPSWLRGTLDPAMPALEEQCASGLSEHAARWDVDLGPGEVLFVPGGAPHAVHNLDSTVAFAGNFVDDANLERALVDLKLMGLNQGERMMESFIALDEIDFDDATDLDDDDADADADAPLDPRDLVVAIDAHLARRP
ncbi:JmjC domain [Ostreococcus tauri]|uniref:JmjC domain n=1 Tax=Ostreococcus tauri TaxID=70448 RepID=A0A096P847_OSTTA|nr:JmjC domain [Ostreococcus tauri]CEG00182.1 JmjC domain [Ostreococcus tauri]|eukprot:XP_022840238.1 JmjC domain [Ostreococcus tauri]